MFFIMRWREIIFLSPEESKEFGLVDHIIESRKSITSIGEIMTLKDSALRCSFLWKKPKGSQKN
jgi:hypothetical protein